MSRFQRDLEHVVLLDMDAKDDYIPHNLTNRSIYEYWRHTPVFTDFFLSTNVPDWKLSFMRSLSYAYVCKLKWYKDLCHSFRAYIMRHFYFVDRRSCLENYLITYTKELDLQSLLNL